MPAPSLTDLMARRSGHFRFESGHHGELWFDLERLCLYPGRLQSLAAELAAPLSKRVLPNAPQSSQLWLKLANDPAKCNAFMPADAGMALKFSQPGAFNKIDKWIRQGAKNN